MKRRTADLFVDFAPRTALIVTANVLTVLERSYVIGTKSGAPGGFAFGPMPRRIVATHFVDQQ